MTEKLVRDGKVAILYAPTPGAGWSTWNEGSEFAERMIFDPQLVALVEAGDRSGAAALAKTFDTSDNPYVSVLGADDLVVAWLPIGTEFYIHEYAGSESIKTRNSDNWRIA